MNYVVLDLEWNQCPSGKTHEIKELPFEIIEIGAVRLDASHKIVDQFREVIKPQVYSDLHFKTKEIISLRSMDFEGARNFSEVIADFFDWCQKDPLFCTWGPSDLTELQRNLAYYGISSPFCFPLMYYDIQKIFSIVFEDRKSRRSLEYAVDFLQISKEIPFHSALSDAVYTSMIMQRLKDEEIFANSSIDYFQTPQTRKQEIYLHYDTYNKFVSKPFSSRNQAMKDQVVTSTPCFVCGKNACKKVGWFSCGGHNHFCISCCEQHGYMKGKIRLRQRTDGKTYAVKTIKPVSEEEAYLIYEKKEIVQFKRRLHREFHRQNHKPEKKAATDQS